MLVKAMRLPPGDHAGSPSNAGLLVSRTGLVPSAFITQMSELPLRVLSKAIFLPSGDQAGSPSNPTVVVSGLGKLPFAFIT
jgi:hypothetical protein